MRRSLPIVLTLLLGCGGAVREAESLVEDGALADAERVLTAEIAEHPANLEAVLLRGTTASIGYACSSKCAADFAASMRAENDAGRIVRMARAVANAEPKAAPALAAAMLDSAERFGRQRQDDAQLLVREALILDRSLEPDRRVAAVRGRVDTFREPAPARRQFLEGTELQVTAQALGIVGAAIHQYFDYHRRLPPSGTMATLQPHLVPHFLSQPYTDGWGGMIHYVAAGWRFRLVSAGDDGRVSAESLDLRRAPRGMVEELGADVIWEGGVVQMPGLLQTAADRKTVR